MKHTATIEELLGDLDTPEPKNQPKFPELVTFRLPPEDKARYERLQETTDGRFGKKVRTLILAAIDVAEKRTTSRVA